MHIQLFNAEKAYIKQLEQCLRAIHREAGQSKASCSLYQFIAGAQGTYPVDVVATLEKLGLPYCQDQWAHYKGTDVEMSAPTQELPSIFADPHPADYDWRFAPASIPLLTTMITGAAKGAAIALLGTKTLFPPLYDSGATVTLFNKSASLLGDLRRAGYQQGLAEYDLCQPLANGNDEYRVAFADPPWYLDYYQAFLHRASELLEVGGFLYLSVLPSLTRPSAVADRTDILQMATQLGSGLVEQKNAALAYETPAFEHQALLARNLCCGNWRAGDLWVFQKNKQRLAGASIVTPIGEQQWREYRIGIKRIKVKSKLNQEEKRFAYQPADPSGNVFTQVSRRSPFRSQIDVWSSDNQAYTVSRLSVLECYLDKLERNGSLTLTTELLNKNREVNEAERTELIALLQELAR